MSARPVVRAWVTGRAWHATCLACLDGHESPDPLGPVGWVLIHAMTVHRQGPAVAAELARQIEVDLRDSVETDRRPVIGVDVVRYGWLGGPGPPLRATRGQGTGPGKRHATYTQVTDPT